METLVMLDDQPLNVLMLASEAVPFAKTGGLADAVGGLADALARRGHNVTLVLPFYRSVRELSLETTATIDLDMPLESPGVSVRAHCLRAPGLPFNTWCIDCPDSFDRDGLYVDDQGRDFPDNSQRFGLLCRAALLLADRLRPQVEIIHAHDWQTGLVPVYVRAARAGSSTFRGAATVFTIHNLAYQGRFANDLWPTTHLDPSLNSPEGLEFWGEWSMLKGGILFSDQITTVSPTYAREIQGQALGMGMEGVVRARSHRLTGIVNGIDTERWNPATDPRLPVNYDARAWRDGKRECKRRLLAETTLSPDGDRPLVGMVGRMAAQKGIDVIPEIAKDLLKTPLQFVVLGQGDAALEETVAQWARIYPDRVWSKIAFDESLASLIYAASDIFLMPSRFEPCGLSQLYAQRYGSIPIVHATGGLADTVCDATPDSLERGTATGFQFRPFGATSLVGAIDRALEAWRSPDVWGRLVAGAMRGDWSWNASAAEYERVYRQAVEARHRMRR